MNARVFYDMDSDPSNPGWVGRYNWKDGECDVILDDAATPEEAVAEFAAHLNIPTSEVEVIGV